VALPLLLNGMGRGPAEALAATWFPRLGLGGLERRRPGELSGGQAQRVFIRPSNRRVNVGLAIGSGRCARVGRPAPPGPWPGHLELIEQLEAAYRHRARHLPGGEAADGNLDQELLEHQAIRRSVIAAERNAVIELRDRGVINDVVLRSLERELDLEALRMEA
jgi:hypothetical protein